MAPKPTPSKITVQRYRDLEAEVETLRAQVKEFEEERGRIECPVCQDSIVDVFLGCRHTLCRECATNLLLCDDPCPLCRAPLHSFTTFCTYEKEKPREPEPAPEPIKYRGMPDEMDQRSHLDQYVSSATFVPTRVNDHLIRS
jgi:hypothetical protein